MVLTVAAQVYTNVQNYHVNKQRFERDIQQALDLAVEAYFADRVRNGVFVFTPEFDIPDSLDAQNTINLHGKVSFGSGGSFATLIQENVSGETCFEKDHSIRKAISSVETEIDSTSIFCLEQDNVQSIKFFNQGSVDDLKEIQLLTKKILSSLTTRSIDLDRLDNYLESELERKGIDVGYQLVFTTPNKVHLSNNKKDYSLTTFSKSTYLPGGNKLKINYENASLVILKRGAFDLFVSLLIICAVLGSLIYLYHVINQQKQLAEIKNDLISNITHEFKTPIATISTAIEGISTFNQTNDPEKTKKYLGISSDQLNKLNTMVEKLLETATLDSDEIDLNKEAVDAVQMTKKLIEKFEMVKGQKDLSFVCEQDELIVDMDPFHMENAISNLIDNAMKYGGERVAVSLRTEGEQTVWRISDNGKGIEKQQKAHIFDKFYRVPTGNVHDVKGFGIGLYYSKAMVQKHGGTINLKSGDHETVFTIHI